MSKYATVGHAYHRGLDTRAPGPTSITVAELKRLGDTPSMSIGDVEERSGVPACTIRIWEQRYGWPKPARASNTYRKFTPNQVAELEAVMKRVKAGERIGEILAGGKPS